MDSSSRLRARPTEPSSNSSSSLTAASGRPETRAIPSPTSVTRPTMRASRSPSNPSMFFLIADAMSAAESVSSGIWLLLEAGFEMFESGTDRTVDDRVAHRGQDATQHTGVDDGTHTDVLAGGVGERGGDAGLLVGGELDRRADLG